MTNNLAKATPLAPRYTRALRCEIIKPIDLSWDEVGPVLRRQRAVGHRLLNSAVVACLDASRKILDVAPQTAAYQAVKTELESFRKWAAAHRDPQVKGLADIDLPGGTIAGYGSLAFDAFSKWKKERGNVGLPSFKRGQPIPIRRQESRVETDERGAVFACKLVGGRGDWHRFALAPSKGKHRGTLEKLAREGSGFEQLAAKLDYDERRKKWFVVISYSAPVVKAELDPDRILAVHRGCFNFLFMLASDRTHGVSLRGEKLLRFKQQTRARRESYRRIRRGERGAGAEGHGVARRYGFSDSLSESEARFVDTFTKQAAARVAELAVAWGCGTVVIGDYGGIAPAEERGERRFVERFPFHRLKLAIACALEPRGIALEEVSEAYVSQTCPHCGHSEDGSLNRRTGVFHCRGSGCTFERPGDLVSAWHMLRRFGAKDPAFEKGLAREANLADQVRKGTP